MKVIRSTLNLFAKTSFLNSISLILALVFGISIFQGHTFAASGGVCHDSFSNISYKCGTAGINPCSFIPIQGQSPSGQGNCDPSACASQSCPSASIWTFDPTQCYLLSTVPNSSAEQWVGGQNCSGADYTTNVQSTTIPSNVTPPDAAANCSTNCNLITEYLNPIINFLSAAVGIVVVMMIVVGGIQYSSSGGNPQSAAAAKKRIANAILAAFAFLFLYGFLQFIVPGGLFNG